MKTAGVYELLGQPSYRVTFLYSIYIKLAVSRLRYQLQFILHSQNVLKVNSDNILQFIVFLTPISCMARIASGVKQMLSAAFPKAS